MDQNYNNPSFWQFADQLRLQTASLANLSTNDSIWSHSFVSRKNTNSFDVRVGAELGSSNSNPNLPSDVNSFNNDGWNSFKPSSGSGLLGNSFNPKSLKDPVNDYEAWNSFKPITESDLIGNGFNPKSLKDPVNDYEAWNSFKPTTGSDLLGSRMNPQPLSGSSKSKDPVNDFQTWNSFKPGIGSNKNPFGSIPNPNNPVNEYGLWNNLKPKATADYNGFNDGWKINNNGFNGATIPAKNQNPNGKEMGKNYYGKGLSYKLGAPANGSGNLKAAGKKGKGEGGAAVEKRFKTLPAAEALPREEKIGGYIFVCNNETMAENLKRELFGLPPRYRDSVRAITPGLPLFLYNYSTHQLHGVFEAASFGGTNIDPTAWEDKKCPGESRFPAQVRVITRQICEPLEEDSFRPILHHYDGPKFRLELSIPEAISLLDVLYHQNSD